LLTHACVLHDGAWNSPGLLVGGPPILVTKLFMDTLVVAGSFNVFGGIETSRLALFDGHEVRAAEGAPVDGPVVGLEVFDGLLYVAELMPDTNLVRTWVWDGGREWAQAGAPMPDRPGVPLCCGNPAAATRLSATSDSLFLVHRMQLYRWRPSVGSQEESMGQVRSRF